jgi:Rap1a immunity proteins
MRPVIAVAVLLMFCGGVKAQTTTIDTSANSVFLGCKAFTETQGTTNLQLNQLGNYCSGIVHGLAGISEYLTPLEWQSCIPSTSTARQMARVVISYIEARPQRMHEDFRRLTLEAFHHAWPCKSDR